MLQNKGLDVFSYKISASDVYEVNHNWKSKKYFDNDCGIYTMMSMLVFEGEEKIKLDDLTKVSYN